MKSQSFGGIRARKLTICRLALVFALGAPFARGQAPAAQHQGNLQQPGNTMSVSTGEAHAAVLDAQQRPITAGGFVAAGPIIFQDTAGSAGLTTWTHHMGTPQKDLIVETVGSGVALLDYDNGCGRQQHGQYAEPASKRRQE